MESASKWTKAPNSGKIGGDSVFVGTMSVDTDRFPAIDASFLVAGGL